ncbi:MAG TPA: hypothetical protein VHV26_00155 [Rhizomicrobium sp.]|jgi:hypothetical protein|nr:hypothetical protein [Rhizomicrobium sp.]
MKDAITARARQFREEWGGLALSLLLHLLLALAAFWYIAHRPTLRQTSFRALPVELVLGEETKAPGPSTTEAAPKRQRARQRRQSAPVPEGTRPNAVKQPEDELSAKLRALAQLRQPETDLPAADNETGAGGNGSGAGSYSLKDFVRAQILRRWWPDLSIPGARNLPVLVRVKLLRDGVIDDVEILDQQRFLNDKPFRNMAISARNAALLASPLDLPPGHYDKVMRLVIDLDPNAVLR